MKSYLKDKASLKTTQKELSALKKSSINPKTFSSVKKVLSQTKTKLDLATKKSSRYSKLYVGLKEKYSNTEKYTKHLRDKITRQESSLAYIKKRADYFESKYKKAMSQSATSRTTIMKMKLHHQRQMQNLNTKLDQASKEANIANEKVSALLIELDEIEKNEKQAREESLTQALLNTRDVVFDNTIATNLGGVGESTSRGFAFMAGLVVAGYMISRVD